MSRSRTWDTAGRLLLAVAIALTLVSGRTLAAPGDLLSTAVYLSDGSQFPGWSQWSDRDGGSIDSAKWVSGDFNGDGKTDIAASWNNSGTPAGDCQKAEEPYSGYVDTVPQTDADVVNAEHALLYLVNVERTQRGLAALCYNGQLAPEARAHSKDWATNPDRTCPQHNPPLVCAHWDSRAGYSWPEDRFTKSGYGPTVPVENTQNGGGLSDGTNVVPAG